ncbi:metallophosphoesterase [Streptoalloteichus hindustanus]|uniref:Calcineurin-like phosphoesterase n=1 Tax=Streptoalloteichus hindustanus TaxID=2017 RepID=A0A1M5B7K4_STRHI|nr:metallophosphoesterase [Streptoalloteichus hindustanus]SHF38428.1 Calcineurin-like phosphoesterase [Streptoalloteichus hindustanus]
MIVVAHVSDIHLDGGERSAERAERVFAYLDALPRPVDAVLVTGDIADHGLAAEYERASKILPTSAPVFTCPGNHDVRSAYRQDLLDQPVGDEPVNQVHRAGGAVFALCDSTIPTRDDGVLTDQTLSWLDEVLTEAADEPVFVCFHHPPVRLHSPFIDEIRQYGEDQLAAVLARHPQVVAVLCGHAHTAAASTFAGRPLLVAPGVVSTLRLPWESGRTLDHNLPPALAFHVLDDDRRLTTHYRVIP